MGRYQSTKYSISSTMAFPKKVSILSRNMTAHRLFQFPKSIVSSLMMSNLSLFIFILTHCVRTHENYFQNRYRNLHKTTTTVKWVGNLRRANISFITVFEHNVYKRSHCFSPQKYDTRSYILIKLVHLHNTYDTVKL